MNWVVTVGAASLALGLSALFWVALAGGPSARSVQANLVRGFESGGGKELRRAPGRGGLGRVVAHPAIVRRIDRLLGAAGRPPAWPTGRVLDVKLLVALLLGFLGFLIYSKAGTPQSLLLLLALVLGGFFLPDLLLYNTGIKRRQTISLELPDTLDQMSIAVEAGLGFDAAMARVARNGKGILAGELIRTLQDIQVGQSRRMAFESLATRVAVPELRRFIRSVVQAEEYGLALSDVLGIQAKEMRVARRQRAEHKAMQIPVKVSFPLILFILPVLMIVVMGPGAIGIIEAFSR